MQALQAYLRFCLSRIVGTARRFSGISMRRSDRKLTPLFLHKWYIRRPLCCEKSAARTAPPRVRTLERPRPHSSDSPSWRNSGSWKICIWEFGLEAPYKRMIRLDDPASSSALTAQCPLLTRITHFAAQMSARAHLHAMSIATVEDRRHLIVPLPMRIVAVGRLRPREAPEADIRLRIQTMKYSTSWATSLMGSRIGRSVFSRMPTFS